MLNKEKKAREVWEVIEAREAREAREAVCVFTTGSSNIRGYVLLKEDLEKKDIVIRIKLKGLSPGNHGFHIHRAGDLRDKCESLCSHFNPFNKNHGGPKDKDRHVGDLGNLIADEKGRVNIKMRDKQIKLRGKHSIIGRSMIIHEESDDLGRGKGKKREASLKTGNSGKRIACGIIGISKDSPYHK